MRSRVNIVVQCSVITLLEWISETITAVQCALFGTGDRCQSPVTFFTRVNNTITTTWETTIWSAVIWLVGIEMSIIALLSTINNTITNIWETTLQTASIWFAVRVHWTLIAFLTQEFLRLSVTVSASVITREVELELGEER
jgi:hypothetical protein